MRRSKHKRTCAHNGSHRKGIRLLGAPPERLQGSLALPPTGFEALERRLAQARPEPARKARAEDWLRIPVTPDVELAVRGRLDAEQRARLERCADLIRDILLGRDP